MCKKHSSVFASLTPCKRIRCDKCIRHLLESMYRHGFESVASCCGHGIYPMTIVCRSKTGGDRYYEVLSGKVITRTRNFYKKDMAGNYFIPESLGRKDDI